LANPADGVSSFHSLFAALHKSAAFAAGDVIQIEPGSNPGTVLNTDLQVPAVANITIQGDLAAAGTLANIPHLIIGNFYTGATAQANWTFKNLNIDLTDNTGGTTAQPAMELDGGGTVIGCAITIGKNANNGFFVDFDAGATANAVNTFTDNTIVIGTPTSAATTSLALLEIDSGSNAGDKDVIAGNVFQANVAANFLIDYDGDGVAGQTEQIANNTFIGSASSNLTALVNVGFGGAITGMTIQGNTFTDPDSTSAGVSGVKLDESTANAASAQSATVTGNTFSLTGSKAIDVNILGGTTGKTTTTDVISYNVLGAHSGTGLEITAGKTAGGAGAGDVVKVAAFGNNFNSDQFGVQVLTKATTSPANFDVDLGGGAFGSPGANNLRGVPVGSATGGAVVVINANPASLTTIQAQNDIFTGTATADVFNGGFANAAINVGNALSANAAFVESLYLDVLGRAGNTSSPSDAGHWVTALGNGSMSQAAVASAINHSTEALDRSIGGLYVKLLNRQPDAPGLAGFVSYVQSGGTIEQVIVALVSSPEYAGLVGNDIAFVESLFIEILGRVGSQAEVAAWVGRIGTIGRAGVAQGFVNSVEFRTEAVRGLYINTPPTTAGPTPLVLTGFTDLLRRTVAPSTAEVSDWVNSGLDLLSIETGFLSSNEFFVDG
jgi:hypothetical protein